MSVLFKPEIIEDDYGDQLRAHHEVLVVSAYTAHTGIWTWIICNVDISN